MNIPTHLYHYTNIENLALILKNKTIRFNPLDRMDDLQEKEASDVKNIGKIFYVSSWTEDETESIPMWNMYASLKAGIRIKMKSIPFENRGHNYDEIKRALPPAMKFEVQGDPPKTLIPYSDMITHGFLVVPNDAERILHKVEYTSDKNKLCPRLLSYVNEQMRISFEPIGKYKNMHWEFQHEWRYIFCMVSHDIIAAPKDQNNAFIKTMERILVGDYEQAIPFYDIPITQEAFSEMEITLSPRISAGNRIIVENLIEKYNPSAKISDSSLVGLI